MCRVYCSAGAAFAGAEEPEVAVQACARAVRPVGGSRAKSRRGCTHRPNRQKFPRLVWGPDIALFLREKCTTLAETAKPVAKVDHLQVFYAKSYFRRIRVVPL